MRNPCAAARTERCARISFLCQIAAIVGMWMPMTVSRAFAAEAPEPLPVTADLHKLFDDGQYQPLLAKLTRVLQLKGNAARPYDRVELELLRADALLELKQQSSAIGAVAEAVKAINDQTEEKLAAQAKATQMLLKRSQAFVFTPKTAPKGQIPKPISLLDMALRKDAFTGLLADVRAEMAVKIKSAKGAKTIPPIIEAIRAIADMRAVETTATGQDADSKQLADDLATQAKVLMGDAVKTMRKKVKDIDDAANNLLPNPSLTRNGAPTETTYHKRGLDFKATGDLKEIVATCETIVSVSRDFSEVSRQSADGFKELADTAEKTAKAASETLNADYNGSYGKR